MSRGREQELQRAYRAGYETGREDGPGQPSRRWSEALKEAWYEAWRAGEQDRLRERVTKDGSLIQYDAS